MRKMRRLPPEIEAIIWDYKLAFEAFEEHERWIAFLELIFSSLLWPLVSS